MRYHAADLTATSCSKEAINIQIKQTILDF